MQTKVLIFVLCFSNKTMIAHSKRDRCATMFITEFAFSWISPVISPWAHHHDIAEVDAPIHTEERCDGGMPSHCHLCWVRVGNITSRIRHQAVRMEHTARATPLLLHHFSYDG